MNIQNQYNEQYNEQLNSLLNAIESLSQIAKQKQLIIDSQNEIIQKLKQDIKNLTEKYNKIKIQNSIPNAKEWALKKRREKNDNEKNA